MIGMSTPVLLLVLGLACARLTRLIIEDEITSPIRRWAVRRWGENGMIPYLLHCRWCVGMWVAAPLCAFCWATDLTTWPVALLLVPATSYAANIIRATIEV
jgi:hypothetical protein